METERGYGDAGEARDVDFGRRRRTFTETKAGYMTTEFFLTVVAIVAILIATYIDDADLGANEGWKYATWVAVAYIISRGLAKVGTREPYIDRG